MFLIIKDNSERVPKKNFQILNNKPLHQYFIDQRKRFDVYIDTDSEDILEFYSQDQYKSYVHAYPRKVEHINIENEGNISPAPLMIERFLDEFVHNDDEIIVTSHITSPFLKDTTVESALKKMSLYTSVSSVKSVQEFAVLGTGGDAQPINFSYDKIVKTQSLKPILILNGAFFIISKGEFLKNGLKRISNNHYYYEVDDLEAIDIDTQQDLLRARVLANEGEINEDT